MSSDNSYRKIANKDKDIRWSDLKDLSLKIAEKIERISPDEAMRIKDCCSELRLFKDKQTGQIYIHRNRCKDRWCPICNHVNSGMMGAFLQQEYERSREEHDMLYSMVFTCKNCSIEDLRTTLKTLSRAFTLLKQKIHRSHVHIKACCRTLEYTYNKELHNMHPHVHVLMNFGPYSPERELMINSINWAAEFAKYLPDEICGWTWSGGQFGKVYSEYSDCYNWLQEHGYTQDPIFKSVEFDMSPYDPNRASMFEFTKYITKFNELLDMSDGDFYACYRATVQMQTRMFSGTWRKWKEKLEYEDGSLYINRERIRQNANLVYFCSVSFRSTTNFAVYTKLLGIRRAKDLPEVTEFLYSNKIFHPPKLE